jgi:minor histocompatibility antigen H13|eukprot:g238.t1
MAKAKASSAGDSPSVDLGNNLTAFCYLGIVGLFLLSNYVIVPTNVLIVSISSFIIWIGSFASLRAKISSDAGEGEEELETMSADDAMMFPVFGSCALFSLYMMFKFFDKYYVNLLLSSYFCLVGIYTLMTTLDPLAKAVFGGDGEGENKRRVFKWQFTLPYFGEQKLEFTLLDVLTFALSATASGVYLQTKHWALNNFFGVSFSIQGIKSISLGSYKVGAILLAGLFLYDIFWVFGTEVMVTVARSFEAPIKLLFLRAFATDEEKAQFSLLGLGDIVIPGIFVALLLRFDAHRAQAASVDARFDKTYFHTTMFGYIAGLITTVVVMFLFESAQPALLYLVPSCLGSSLVVAFKRGEFAELLAYSEEGEPEDEKKKGGEKKKEK